MNGRDGKTGTRRKGLAGLTLLLSPVLLVGATLARGADTSSDKVSQESFEKQIRPVLQQFCNGCHGEKNPAGGINLIAFKEVASIQRDQTTWRKVLTQVRERHMPPSNVPQPSADQRDLLSFWLAHTLNNADDSLLPKNPGRVLIHRLSRTEYNNTVRDLFGVTSRPADRFPADGGGGGGFDNDANTLFIPPVLMEKYLEAADDILTEAKPARVFVVRPGKQLPAREAAKRVLAYQAGRAFRRPVEAAEVSRLLGLYDKATQRGAKFADAVKFALKAVLVSPHFLFRVEKDRPGKDAYPVSDYELASRLSYFLWASMPDDTLLQLAAQKRLRNPKVLETQAKRMLADPKARDMADSFAGQWLKVRDLYTGAQPDGGKYPNYSPQLRDALYGETIAFFYNLLHEDRSLLELIDADYTFLNEDLAKHYGITGITGPEMRRVRLADHRRGGVLTMGSVLTLSSYPQRTSPVLRGKWVLSEILGSPPPPPPPVVPALSTNDTPENGLTFRQRLEKHRANPTCASCHNRLDPLGFGLENFDATGRWRDTLGGTPVDASGTLATGEKFVGPAELKKLLLARKEDVVRNLTERMLAYALGRGSEPYDLPAIKKITAAVARNDYRSSTLVLEIVKSYPFQYRKNL